MSDIVFEYFPDLDEKSKALISKLEPLYQEWNSRINVISRKDMDHFYEHHVLHSLAIAKVIEFPPDSLILDAGTGGGFPGIPLAILFPDTRFLLADSIGKKIRVVDEVKNALGLENVETFNGRFESLKIKADFIVSRAVTRLDTMVPWIRDKVNKKGSANLPNGLLYLKGGSFDEELKGLRTKLFPITDYFNLPHFKDKYVVHITL